MGTGTFPGVKRPGRGADPHPYLQCRGLKLGRAITLPTLRALVVCYMENLYLYLYCHILCCAYCILSHTDKFTFCEATKSIPMAGEADAHSLPTAALFSNPFWHNLTGQKAGRECSR